MRAFTFMALLSAVPLARPSDDRAHLLRKVAKHRHDESLAAKPGGQDEPACAAAGHRRELSLCAPLAPGGCTRPPGAFHMAMRSTGSYVIAKSTLRVWGGRPSTTARPPPRAHHQRASASLAPHHLRLRTTHGPPPPHRPPQTRSTCYSPSRTSAGATASRRPTRGTTSSTAWQRPKAGCARSR